MIYSYYRFCHSYVHIYDCVTIISNSITVKSEKSIIYCGNRPNQTNTLYILTVLVGFICHYNLAKQFWDLPEQVFSQIG